MKATLLVEILTEELPPKSLRSLSEAFLQGIAKGLAAAQLELRQAMETLVQVDGRIREVERAQAEMLSQVPYADLLRSVPGLGVVTVFLFMGPVMVIGTYWSVIGCTWSACPLVVRNRCGSRALTV